MNPKSTSKHPDDSQFANGDKRAESGSKESGMHSKTNEEAWLDHRAIKRSASEPKASDRAINGNIAALTFRTNELYQPEKQQGGSGKSSDEHRQQRQQLIGLIEQIEQPKSPAPLPVKSEFESLMQTAIINSREHDLGGNQTERMQNNLQAIEARQGQLEELYRKQLSTENKGLSKGEIASRAHEKAEHELAETYRHVAELLSQRSIVPGMTKKLQQQIAEEILRNVRYDLIDQGDHNTCALTVLEKRAYARTPSEAARLVAGVALSGTYISTRNHVRVNLDQESIIPDDEAQITPAKDSVRGLASQIFQVTAANVYFQARQRPYQYEQHAPGRVDNGESCLSDDDTGERVKDLRSGKYVKDAYGKYVCDPYEAGIKFATEIIDAEISSKPGEASQSGWYFERLNPGDLTVSSPEDFARDLTQALDQGKGPLVFATDTTNAPFYGKHGHHVATIDSYNPPTYPTELPTFFLDNQWGQSDDHKHESVYVLYGARLAMTSLDPNLLFSRIGGTFGIESQATNNFLSNQYLQLEHIQRDYHDKKLSLPDYVQAVKDQLDATHAQHDLHDYNFEKFNQQKFDQLELKLQSIFTELPDPKRIELIKYRAMTQSKITHSI